MHCLKTSSRRKDDDGKKYVVGERKRLPVVGNIGIMLLG